MLTDTPLSVADVLERAADLIEPPGAWTQGTYARGKTGRPVKAKGRATCFCVVGAMDAVQGAEIGLETWLEPIRVVTQVATGSRNGNIADWNDAPERTQPEVVAALRRAATLARAEVQA